MNYKDFPKRRKKRYKKPIKFDTILIGAAIVILVMILVRSAYESSAPEKADLSYPEFETLLQNGEIESAYIIKTADTFNVTTKDGKGYKVINPGHDEFKKELLEAGVDISISHTTADDAVLSVIGSLPMYIFMFIIVYVLVNSVGRQTTTLFKVLRGEEIITFKDVAGMSETKKEVEFAVSQLKNSDKLKAIGTRPCKGIILEGPPGTGKTLLAKAIAGEAGVPFISTSGSDFIEVFAGLGAARVRSLWDLAKINAPCVIFIDEIDAVGRRRSSAGDSVTTESNQTLNAILQRMDGLSPSSGIFVVAATNRIQDLDPALLRPGRFDKHLYIGPPTNKKDRDEIIRVHMKGKKFDESVDFDKASKLMFGLSGAEIEQVLNESVLISLQDGREGLVSLDDIDNAAMKLRASGVQTTHSSESDRNIVAVHEAGHAVVNLALGRKVSKISILPYSSGVGGFTVEDTDVKENKRLKTKSELLDDIRVLLAGRESEALILGDTSIGCSNDIQRASVIAFNIVNNFAMSDDSLINVSALGEVGVQLVDTKDIIAKADKIMKDCQADVDRILADNKNAIIDLRDKLLKDEVVFEPDNSILDVK